MKGSEVFCVKRGVGFFLLPYFNRLKLGEGGLVVFTLFHSIFAHDNWLLIAQEFSLSFLVLISLYGFNDYKDRRKDLANEKKDKIFVAQIIESEKLFLSINTITTLVCIFGSFFIRGPLGGLFVLLVYAVNYIYSIKTKSMPIVDLFSVVLWGACFILTSGHFNLTLFFAAGVMTGIAHLFQMLTDKHVDQINATNTSVVYYWGKEWVLLMILCLILCGVLYFSTSWYWALSGLIPLLVFKITNHVNYSWHISRFYFFVVWIGLLNSIYGSSQIGAISLGI